MDKTLIVIWPDFSVVAQAASQPNAWESLEEAIASNPTLTILGLILAAFMAGFGARKFLEERELSKLRSVESELKQQLEATSREKKIAEDSRNAGVELAKDLALHFSPASIQATLADHLALWPSEYHQALAGSIVRQLLTTPGQARFYTPKHVISIRASIEPSEGKTTLHKTFAPADPIIKELRVAAGTEQRLLELLKELAVNGITRVDRRIAPDRIQTVFAFVDPLGHFVTEELISQRVA